HRPAQADQVEEAGYPIRELAGGEAAEPPVEVEELTRREEVVEVGVLGQVAEASPGLAGGDGLDEAAGAPRGGRDQPDQHLDRRALTRAVRTEEAVDLPLPDGEVEILDGPHLPPPQAESEALGELLRDEYGLAHEVRA